MKLAVYDINIKHINQNQRKHAFLLRDNPFDEDCTYKDFYDRADSLYKTAKEFKIIEEIQHDVHDIVEKHLNQFPQIKSHARGEEFRKNLITNYLADMPERFACIANIAKKDWQAPPPISVQLEVANNG